jgi:hypothetical protein
MAKVIPEHKDKLGRVLALGDCVVYPQSNSLAFGTIKKFNPKMIKVCPVGSKWEQNKYPEDIVKVEGPEVTVYLLKRNSAK